MAEIHDETVEMVTSGRLDNELINQTIEEVGEYIDAKADEGREIIVNRLSEERFVKFMQTLISTLLQSMYNDGGAGAFLVMASMNGELKPYTDTVIMAVLGVLAEEEVI